MFDPADNHKNQPTGSIVFCAERIETGHLLEEAKAATAKELEPGNLINQVDCLIGKLKALGGFVSTIEKLTKVLSHCPRIVVETLKCL